MRTSLILLVMLGGSSTLTPFASVRCEQKTLAKITNNPVKMIMIRQISKSLFRSFKQYLSREISAVFPKRKFTNI